MRDEDRKIRLGMDAQRCTELQRVEEKRGWGITRETRDEKEVEKGGQTIERNSVHWGRTREWASEWMNEVPTRAILIHPISGIIFIKHLEGLATVHPALQLLNSELNENLWLDFSDRIHSFLF